MRQHAVPIERLAELTVTELDTKDKTLVALISIANAYRAISELGEDFDITFYGKPLVLRWLRRAYRETLMVRHNLPEEFLTENVLTKFGRIPE